MSSVVPSQVAGAVRGPARFAPRLPVLIVLGVLVFLIGLVSEQVASLRFEGRRQEPRP